MAENGLRDVRYSKIALFAFFIFIKPLLYHCYYEVPINQEHWYTPDFLPGPSYSGKTKFSVLKITSAFGLSSGVVQQFYEHVLESENRLG